MSVTEAPLRNRRIAKRVLYIVVVAIGTLVVLAAIAVGLVFWHGARVKAENRQKLTNILDKVAMTGYQQVDSQFKDSSEPPEGIYLEGYFVGPPSNDTQSSEVDDEGMRLTSVSSADGCRVDVRRFDPASRATPSIALSNEKLEQVRARKLDLISMAILCDNDW